MLDINEIICLYTTERPIGEAPDRTAVKTESQI